MAGLDPTIHAFCASKWRLAAIGSSRRAGAFLAMNIAIPSPDRLTPAVFANDHDTIFAPASGAGRAAIAVLRISGPGCSEALQGNCAWGRISRPPRCLANARHPQSRGPLDRALITRFQAPRSFTGEEMAEISVTGGRAVTSALVRALALIPGLRPAEPGEFAWRAFMNGKIDLSEVEGLADLVEAETEAQRRQAQRIAGGALSRECEAIRARLLEAMAAVETQIDFTDVEDASDFTLESVRARGARRNRADRPGARDGGLGPAPARGLHSRDRRASQCREVDADERAGRPRCRDHFANPRNDPRSDRGVSRPARLSGHPRRHRGHPRQPTTRSNRKASRERAAEPRART